MTKSLRRALCAAAGALAFASVAHAAMPVPLSFQPGLPSTDAAAIDFTSADLLPSVSYGPPPARHLPSAVVSAEIPLAGNLSLAIGNKVDLAGSVTPIAASDTHDAGDLLFDAGASEGYNAPAAGGTAFSISSALSNGLKVNLGVAMLAPGISNFANSPSDAVLRMGGDAVPYARRGAQTVTAGLTWDLNSWAQLGVAGTQSYETDGLFGIAAPGVNATTTAVGVSAKVRLGNGWVTTASYSEGISQLDLKPGIHTAAMPFDPLRTRAYGIAIAKNGLFGDDALGVAVTRPALGGNEFVTLPGASGWPAFATRNQHLESPVPETDVEIGYVTTFMDGAVALQTNAAFQMNYAGQYGANAVSLLSRARIKF